MASTPNGPGSQAGRRVFRFGEFVLDEDRAALFRNGVETTLRPKCFEVLRVLVGNTGRLVTKDELLDTVWAGVVVTEGSVAQCIAEIRRALGDTEQTMVRTVPRRGFIFELPAADPEPAQPAAERSGGSRRWIAGLAVLAVLVAAGWWAAGQKATRQAEPAAVVALSAPQNSIAVLRFADLSPAGDQAYFADGLAEEILHLLAQSEELQVVARTSSFTFAPGAVDVQTIARELGVAYVLEGSVRREQDDLRVTSQLIDASTGYHVWSQAYDRKSEDLIRLQQEIALAVAAALDAALAPAERGTTPAQAEAHELFLLGRHLFHRREPGDLESAEQHLQRAVELDPQHAAAWTALAGVYSVRGSDELADPLYRLEDQRQALEHALEIDPSQAEAHVRLARYFGISGNPGAARASLDRAFELAPNDPLVLHARANLAAAEGRLQDVLAFRRQAVATSPLSALYRANLGHALLAAGELEEGLEQLHRARELGSNPTLARNIAAALLLLGRDDDARREMATLPPGPQRDTLVVLLGPQREADETMARLMSDESVWAQLSLAEVAAVRGDTDLAFRYLGNIASRIAQMDGSDPDRKVWLRVYFSALTGTLRGDLRWSGLVDQFREALSLGLAAESSADAAS
jgi:TolB-like protein/DNA-binding winged helix-turn-helix (wHTH) protein